MNPYAFLSQLESDQIRAAILRAERNTSGEIRVLIVHEPAPDPVAEAHARFRALRMHKTKRRNAILIFIAPASQTFAVVGDVGVHALCGEEFWHDLRDAMVPHLKARHYTEAIVLAIARAGELLAQHFPPTSDDRDELPDAVLEE
ncbi:MAG TPA: TPM domain-containing protein [Phycisphaerae bacterium]|jgi:uncharacterized membrane protein|nr:TPM domain-containing protein [Phycisphaerae bacterium]